MLQDIYNLISIAGFYDILFFFQFLLLSFHVKMCTSMAS
jgi:uncharacterized membrane protein YuzA (DUF378 family)